MNEANTWLGNQSNGVMAVGNDNKTNFQQIGIEYVLKEGSVNFDYSKGKTNINTNSESLIKI